MCEQFFRLCSLRLGFLIIHKNSNNRSQETHYLSSTKIRRILQFSEEVALCCGNSTKHTDIFYVQNAEIWYVIAGGTYTSTELYGVHMQSRLSLGV
jgi:hypothetical protein